MNFPCLFVCYNLTIILTYFLLYYILIISLTSTCNPNTPDPKIRRHNQYYSGFYITNIYQSYLDIAVQSMKLWGRILWLFDRSGKMLLFFGWRFRNMVKIMWRMFAVRLYFCGNRRIKLILMSGITFWKVLCFLSVSLGDLGLWKDCLLRIIPSNAKDSLIFIR